MNKKASFGSNVKKNIHEKFLKFCLYHKTAAFAKKKCTASLFCLDSAAVLFPLEEALPRVQKPGIVCFSLPLFLLDVLCIYMCVCVYIYVQQHTTPPWWLMRNTATTVKWSGIWKHLRYKNVSSKLKRTPSFVFLIVVAGFWRERRVLMCVCACFWILLLPLFVANADAAASAAIAKAAVLYIEKLGYVCLDEDGWMVE